MEVTKDKLQRLMLSDEELENICAGVNYNPDGTYTFYDGEVFKYNGITMIVLGTQPGLGMYDFVHVHMLGDGIDSQQDVAVFLLCAVR